MTKLLIILVIGPLLLIIIRGKPSVAIGMYIVSIYLPITAIERNVFGSATLLRNLPYLILALLLFVIFLSRHRPIRRVVSYYPKYIIAAIVVISALSLTSGFLNNIPIVINAFALRWLVVLFGTIYLLSIYFPPSKRIQLLKMLVIMGIVQVPVTLFQRVVMVGMLNIGLGDFVTGLFPKFHHLAFYQISCLIIVLSHKLMGKRLFRFNEIMIMALLIIPLILSNSKASWLYLIFVLGLIYIMGGMNWKKVLQYSGVSVGLILVGLISFNAIYKSNYTAQNLEYIADASYILSYNLGGFETIYDLLESVEDGVVREDFGRVGSIIFNFLMISKSGSTLLLGYGPQKRLESVSGTFDKNIKSNSTYILGNTFSRTLGGYGLFGIAGLGVLLLALFAWAKNNPQENPEIILARKMIVLLMGSMLIYYNIVSAFSTGLVLGVIFMKGEDAGSVGNR